MGVSGKTNKTYEKTIMLGLAGMKRFIEVQQNWISIPCHLLCVMTHEIAININDNEAKYKNGKRLIIISRMLEQHEKLTGIAVHSQLCCPVQAGEPFHLSKTGETI